MRWDFTAPPIVQRFCFSLSMSQTRIAAANRLPYDMAGPGKAESSQSVVVAKSIKWPGAIAVAREGRTVSCVYNGLGVSAPLFLALVAHLPLRAASRLHRHHCHSRHRHCPCLIL